MISEIEFFKSNKFKSFKFKNANLTNEDIKELIYSYASKMTDQEYNYRIFFELYSSNKIEGNTLTRYETKVILENGVSLDCPLKDLLEVVNLNKTIKKYRKIENLSKELILNIHESITSGILDIDNSGRLRKENVYISGSLHLPCPPNEVEERLDIIIDEFNNSSKSLEDVFRFKLKFVAIHPFIDGNGRTSRVIMNGLLEGSGYARIILRDKDKKFYYKALEDATVKYKEESFIKFCLLYMLFMYSLGLDFIKEIE